MNFLVGDSLKKELDSPNLGEEPLIEELIHRKTATMFTALPEAGKSVVSINVFASASSSKSKVFGLLESKELRMAYLQFEGSREEQLGRLKAISNSVPINFKNLSWHEPAIIAERPETWKELERELDQVAPLDLIFIDPLYRVTLRSLRDEGGAIPAIKWMDSLKHKYGASLWVNHHSTKEQYSRDGGKIEKDDPFYGSIWLKAYFDNGFLIKRESKNSTSLTCKKSRASNIIQRLILDFDLGSFTVKANLAQSSMTAQLKVRQYLNELKWGSATTVKKVCGYTGLSWRHITRMKNDGAFSDLIDFIEKPGVETEWLKK